MNIPAVLSIMFVILIAATRQWWLRALFAAECSFAILAAIQEERWRCRGPLAAILLLLVPSLASAADVVPVADAIVRVGEASGVCVDPCGLVMTAKHLDSPSVVQVRFGHRVVSATRVYQCPEPDGPEVFDCDGDGYPFVRIAAIVPPRGSLVSSGGFPLMSPEIKWASGQMFWESRYAYDGRHLNLSPSGTVRANAVGFPVSPGWSGGPLFNDRGELCGVLLASNRCGSLFATHASVVDAYADAYGAVQDARGVLPNLSVRCREQCPPCKRFKDDFASDAKFRAAIDGRYRVTIATVPIDDPSVLTDTFPTFKADGRVEIVGYAGKEKLLEELGINPKPAVRPSPEALVPPPPEDLLERTPFAPPAVASLSLPPPPESPAIVPVIPQTITPQATEVAAQPQPSGVGSSLGKVADVAATAWTIAQWGGLIGATGGVGGLIMGGIALARTFRRITTTARAPPANVVQPVKPAPRTPPTITVENPPPPQAIITETRFAPYERDTFNEAYSYAIKEYTRTYPGSVATIEAVNALMDQYLTSKGIKPPKR